MQPCMDAELLPGYLGSHIGDCLALSESYPRKHLWRNSVKTYPKP